jgi:hypothetical protein
MSGAQFVAAFSLFISATFTLVIWWLMSSFRDDSLRDQLFTVRDKMFLYAVDQGIADTTAHQNLRLLINSLIRYAHRVSLGRLLLLDISRRVLKITPSEPKTYVEWVEAVDALPVEQAQRIKEFHEEAMLLIMKHMVTGSLYLWCASLVVVFHIAVFKSTRVLLHDIFKSTRGFFDGIVRSVTRGVPPGDLFEADALRTT